MNEMWFRSALILASALVIGCSSRVELDVEHEKIATAVEVEDHVTAVSQRSATRLHFGAENTVTEPVVPEKVETHAKRIAAVVEVAEPEMSQEQGDVQQKDAVPQVQTITTTIQFGDISIHVGDNVQFNQQAQVQVQTLKADMSSAEQPPMSVPQMRSRATTSPSQRDAYHERLRREHEMRVRSWQMLFER